MYVLFHYFIKSSVGVRPHWTICGSAPACTTQLDGLFGSTKETTWFDRGSASLRGVVLLSTFKINNNGELH